MARHIPADALEYHLDEVGDRLLPPEAAANILGVTTVWLAAAREGRKGFEGPRFVKLGHGRTSPVRYPYNELVAWLRALERRTSTTRSTSIPQSFQSFLQQARPASRWLFAVHKNSGKATEIIEAIRDNLLDSDDYSYRWLRFTNYTTGRYFPARIVLDADTLKRLREAGDGDISAGLARVLDSLK